jgi:hypothetical protein
MRKFLKESINPRLRKRRKSTRIRFADDGDDDFDIDFNLLGASRGSEPLGN